MTRRASRTFWPARISQLARQRLPPARTPRPHPSCSTTPTRTPCSPPPLLPPPPDRTPSRRSPLPPRSSRAPAPTAPSPATRSWSSCPAPLAATAPQAVCTSRRCVGGWVGGTSYRCCCCCCCVACARPPLVCSALLRGGAGVRPAPAPHRAPASRWAQPHPHARLRPPHARTRHVHATARSRLPFLTALACLRVRLLLPRCS